MRNNHNIDRQRADYIDSGIHPNILAEVSKGDRLGTLEMQPILMNVAKRLAMRQPKWSLVLNCHSINAAGMRKAYRVQVYQEGERLGWFGVGYLYTKNVNTITFDSPALSAVRMRRSHNETADENKAIKAIEKNFYRKPLTQILVNQHSKAAVHLREMAQQGYSVLKGVQRDIDPALIKFVWDNIGEFKGRLIPNYKITEELLDMHTAAEAAYYSANNIQHVTSGKKLGLVIYISENKYYVCNSTQVEGEPPHFTTDTLPQVYKTHIGMLKLVEPGRLVAGVGARIDENTYVIVGEENNHDG